MAASSSAPYGRLLQSTRIATWDPTIPQLYTAPAAFAVRGQYGFKRPVPPPQVSAGPQQGAPSGSSSSSSSSRSAPSLSTLVRQRNIDLVCPDTPAGIAVWATDSIHPRFIKTFEEKGVKLRDYDPGYRLATKKVRPPPAIEPATVFDAATRRVLPSEVDPKDEHALQLARTGLARPGGKSAQRSPFDPTYSFAGEPLGADTSAPIEYTSLDVVPNYARMSDKEFEKYLEHIRTNVRPALIRHLAGTDGRRVSHSAAAAKAAAAARQAEDVKLAAAAQQAKQDGVEAETADAHAEIAAARAPGTIPVAPQQDAAAVEGEAEDTIIVDMWDASRALATSYTTTFLRSQAATGITDPKSTELPSSGQELVPKSDLPPLHRNGGLQYGGPDEIYTSRLHRPSGLPAHVLHRVDVAPKVGTSRQPPSVFSSSVSSSRGGGAVSYGGHVAHIPGPIYPRQVHLEQVYQAADSVTSASSPSGSERAELEDLSQQPSHMLVRSMQAFQAETSSADRVRSLGSGYGLPAPAGVSRTAALAAAAAGRPVGQTREHVVVPDPTSIHVRVRPVFLDEVHAQDTRPLALESRFSTPGTPEYISVKPEPLSKDAALPGIERMTMAAGPGMGGPVARGGPGASRGGNTQRLLSQSMRVPGDGARMSQDMNSFFDKVANAPSTRIARTKVGPAARPKHQSNVKN